MCGGTLKSKSVVKTQVQISLKVVQMKKEDKGLKDAVTSLKKPNFIAVAANIVEDAKGRLTTSSIRSITPLTLKDIRPANLPRPRSVARIHWQMFKSWRPRKVEGQQNLNQTLHLYSRMTLVPRHHHSVTYPKSKIPKHNSRLQVCRSARSNKE